MSPTPQRILIIRPSALGDVARTVPCLASLRRAYPEAQIDWLVGSAFVDAVRAHPALSGVVPFDRKAKASVWPLLRRLRRTKYDLVCDLQGLARSGLFAWATRAPIRVGYANARELGWLGVNHRHTIDPTLHAAERMLALLETHGLPRVKDFTLHVPDESQGYTTHLINEHNAKAVYAHPPQGRHDSLDDNYVAVAPTAQWGCKCWPVERYAELIRRLLGDEPGDGPFTWAAVLSAPAETGRIAEAMADVLPNELFGRICFTSTTVGQMMDVIGNARLLIGNDSAPLHLAVGLETPTVSLFGPTDPALVGPPPADLIGAEAAAKHRVLRAPSAIGQTFNYRTHHNDDTLIAELTVDAVWDAVVEQLP